MSCCQQSDQSQSSCQQADQAESCCQSTNQAMTVQESVKKFYGQEVKTRDDLQTGMNCLVDYKMPKHIRQALGEVHDEVTKKYYGCGPVIPEAVEGCSILDLGSGSGRDCFALSKLVGPSGQVVGIDMTEEQLAVARNHVDYHREKFGYSEPNVEFVMGYIEKLAEAGLKDNSFNIIISNCVINLSPDKTSVLKEAYRVLKEGGEMYFSDVYTDTHLSEALRKHRVLWGECVTGALHWQELYQVAQQIGFSQPRLVTAKMVDISRFADILGDARFVSVTYRLFKLPATSRPASNVTYKGGILGNPDKFVFDRAVTFQKDTAVAADGELSTILSASRFKDFFTFDESGTVTPTTPNPKVDPFQDAEAASGCCG